MDCKLRRETIDNARLICCVHGQLCEIGSSIRRRRDQEERDRIHEYENVPAPNKSKLRSAKTKDVPESTADTDDRSPSATQFYRHYENVDSQRTFVNLHDVDSRSSLTTTETDDKGQDEKAERKQPSSAEAIVSGASSRTIYENIPKQIDDYNKHGGTVKKGHGPAKRVNKDESPTRTGSDRRSPPHSVIGSIPDFQSGGPDRRKTPSELDIPNEDENLIPRSSESEITRTTTVSAASGDKLNPKEQYIQFYLGVCNTQVAELRCSGQGVFRLYHRVVEMDDAGNIQAQLPLYIVYRNNKGVCRHIRILRIGQGQHWRVDIDGEPLFSNLGQLVTFYDIYVSVANNYEPFPCLGGIESDDDAVL